MRKLAGQVGIKAPSIYEHFESKAALLAEVRRSAATELRKSLVAHGKGSRPRARLLGMAKGYLAFANMLKPVLSDPGTFTADLTQGLAAYQGKLLMLSSECSFIGHRYQQEFHLPHMPAQTIHLEAKAMGHNMLTLNARLEQRRHWRILSEY